MPRVFELKWGNHCHSNQCSQTSTVADQDSSGVVYDEKNALLKSPKLCFGVIMARVSKLIFNSLESVILSSYHLFVHYHQVGCVFEE